MKKLLKHLIPFLLAVLITSPVWATTISGCPNTAMQGCAPDAPIVGPTAPFLFENDNWTGLPIGWASIGAADTYSGGNVIIDVTVRNNHIRSPAFTGSPFAEMWFKADWTISAGYAAPNTQENHGFGISSGGTRRAHMGIKNNGGTLQFHTYVQEDGGVVETDIVSPVLTPGSTYQVIIRVLASATPNGQVQMYIDGVEVLSSTGLDFTVAAITSIVLGSINGSAGNPSAGSWTFGNVLVSETGVSP